MKRIICVLLAAVLIFGFCGCKKEEEKGSITASDSQVLTPNAQEINLLCSYSDSFNPYTALTDANRRIGALLFDSLVKVDNDFTAQYCLAESVTAEGKVYTVKLKSARFTDGSAVTAADVVYSYNVAKASQGKYASKLYEVSSVTAKNSETVEFTLSVNDAYFENLLDFPIMKSESAGVTNTDGVEITPIGCGRYILSEDKKSLALNTDYHGKKGSVTKINLINAPDSDSVAHYVEVGATQLYYTNADDGNIVRMSGKRTEVNLNRLIYIGINETYGSLATKQMRYAISSALDRAAICRTAYFNNAVSATGFFNPSFSATAPVQTIKEKPDTQITVENLAKIGYNSMNAEGYYANASGNNPQFSLLVNSENASAVAAARLISQQCAAAGIEINVVERTLEQYKQQLASNSFQLYIGEIEVLGNMDLSQLVVEGGAAAYGVVSEGTVSEQTTEGEDNADEAQAQTAKPQTVKTSAALMVERYHAGECDISDLASTLLTEMTQIPVCYRNGVLFYSTDITGGVKATMGDIYFSIEEYTFN